MFPNKNNPHTVVFEVGVLGSLEVVEAPVQTPTYTFKSYFWRDAQSPQGYGPFESLYEAMKHYGTITKDFKAMTAPLVKSVEDNLIKIDFKTRKRV